MGLLGDMALPCNVNRATSAVFNIDGFVSVPDQVIRTSLHVQGACSASQLEAVKYEVTGNHGLKPHAVFIEIHICMKTTWLFKVFLVRTGGNNVKTIHILGCRSFGKKPESINMSASKPCVNNKGIDLLLGDAKWIHMSNIALISLIHHGPLM